MPIRLNLLAEAQAVEDLRRRDPVKRVVWVGILGVAVVLGWSSSLQLRALIAKGDLNRLDAQIAARTNEYRQVLENQGKLEEVKHRLVKLHELACSRFLQGPVLNSLQQAVIDDIQLTRFRTDQSYVVIEESKTTTNSSNEVIRGHPASVTEKVSISMDARDTGATLGDQIPKFKQALSQTDFFRPLQGQTNEIRLVSLAPPAPGASGKLSVLFTLECRLPEKTR